MNIKNLQSLHGAYLVKAKAEFRKRLSDKLCELSKRYPNRVIRYADSMGSITIDLSRNNNPEIALTVFEGDYEVYSKRPYLTPYMLKDQITPFCDLVNLCRTLQSDYGVYVDSLAIKNGHMLSI